MAQPVYNTETPAFGGEGAHELVPSPLLSSYGCQPGVTWVVGSDRAEHSRAEVTEPLWGLRADAGDLDSTGDWAGFLEGPTRIRGSRTQGEVVGRMRWHFILRAAELRSLSECLKGHILGSAQVRPKGRQGVAGGAQTSAQGHHSSHTEGQPDDFLRTSCECMRKGCLHAETCWFIFSTKSVSPAMFLAWG